MDLRCPRAVLGPGGNRSFSPCTLRKWRRFQLSVTTHDRMAKSVSPTHSRTHALVHSRMYATANESYPLPTRRRHVPLPNNRVGFDAKFLLSREQLNSVCSELQTSFASFLSSVVAKSGVAPGSITSVELIGGGSRMPFVQKIARELVAEEKSSPKLSFTLDIGNAICSGAALLGAAEFFPREVIPAAPEEVQEKGQEDEESKVCRAILNLPPWSTTLSCPRFAPHHRRRVPVLLHRVSRFPLTIRNIYMLDVIVRVKTLCAEIPSI